MGTFLNPLKGTTVPILEKVVNFAQARHSVLAGNLANADTPGYKVRDLNHQEFQDRLKEVVDSQRMPSSQRMSVQDPLDFDSAMKKVDLASKDILYHDQSDVGQEQQVLQISKNQSLHNMAVAIMQNQLNLMRVAITERV